MNLEELKINPNPEPPELIKKIARSFVKKGETYNVFPHKIICNYEKYYYVSFYPKEDKLTGILIIHENGNIPHKKNIIEVLDYVATVDAEMENIFIYGSKWSQRPMEIWKKGQSLLKSFSELVHASDDEDLKKGYEVFCSIPQIMFETQDQLKEIVEKAKDLYRELTTDYLMTKEYFEKVDKTHLHMMESMKKQFEVQIETEKERKQFLKRLRKTISLSDIRKWFLYLRLLKFHRWLNADSATKAEYQNFKADVSREKATEQTRKKLIAMIRNPRG
ncbi:hypothetical protein [Thermoactinomyces mirandus]|uniref:Uncharacterized protein n=1 Tax=Thermoactinomyces mirandus TaxID=2756294 RepID=A0A7W2APY7_9BACL|nr:hypothetical protein [Thermoactinomyces mirandus]MBA4600923.1 hypothetical protein [Thermoactinomyces mirandus]